MAHCTTAFRQRRTDWQSTRESSGRITNLSCGRFLYEGPTAPRAYRPEYPSPRWQVQLPDIPPPPQGTILGRFFWFPGLAA